MNPKKRSKKPAPRARKPRRVLLTVELSTTLNHAQLEHLARFAFAASCEWYPVSTVIDVCQVQVNTIRGRA
jgi:hypothetical protein